MILKQRCRHSSVQNGLRHEQRADGRQVKGQRLLGLVSRRAHPAGAQLLPAQRHIHRRGSAGGQLWVPVPPRHALRQQHLLPHHVQQQLPGEQTVCGQAAGHLQRRHGQPAGLHVRGTAEAGRGERGEHLPCCGSAGHTCADQILRAIPAGARQPLQLSGDDGLRQPVWYELCTYRIMMAKSKVMHYNVALKVTNYIIYFT